jgi:hypothetical protein
LAETARPRLLGGSAVARAVALAPCSGLTVRERTRLFLKTEIRKAREGRSIEGLSAAFDWVEAQPCSRQRGGSAPHPSGWGGGRRVRCREVGKLPKARRSCQEEVATAALDQPGSGQFSEESTHRLARRADEPGDFFLRQG